MSLLQHLHHLETSAMQSNRPSLVVQDMAQRCCTEDLSKEVCHLLLVLHLVVSGCFFLGPWFQRAQTPYLPKPSSHQPAISLICLVPNHLLATSPPKFSSHSTLLHLQLTEETIEVIRHLLSSQGLIELRGEIPTFGKHVQNIWLMSVHLTLPLQ